LAAIAAVAATAATETTGTETARNATVAVSTSAFSVRVKFWKMGQLRRVRHSSTWPHDKAIYKSVYVNVAWIEEEKRENQFCNN